MSGTQINYVAQPLNQIAWKNRNRLFQADTLYSQMDDSLEIEDGCYTELVIAKRNLSGGFVSSDSFNLGTVSSVNPLSLVPDLQDFHAANFLLRTRNNTSAENDPSLNAYSINVEFFGFGVNFGRHFGAYNE